MSQGTLVYVMPRLLIQPDFVFTAGDECDHHYGWSVTVVRGALLGFDPNTAFQRDLWIRAGRNIAERRDRANSIRWLCKECHTLQVPRVRYGSPVGRGHEDVLMRPLPANVRNKA